MLFKVATLEAIAAGDVDLAFRRWRRPRVRAGASLRTAIGLVEVLAIERVEISRLDDDQARRAGYESLAALRAELERHDGESIFRIELRHAGEDPRVALRERSILDAAEWAALARRLERMDARSESGPWTREVLRAIAEQPGRRAGDLAAALGQERLPFKARVRRLKELGLTESLEIGYRLSPRGEALLARIADANDA